MATENYPLVKHTRLDGSQIIVMLSPNAVAIFHNDRKVAYFRREDASRLSKLMKDNLSSDGKYMKIAGFQTRPSSS